MRFFHFFLTFTICAIKTIIQFENATRERRSTQGNDYVQQNEERIQSQSAREEGNGAGWCTMKAFILLFYSHLKILLCHLMWVKVHQIIDFIRQFEAPKRKDIKEPPKECWPLTCIESCWRHFCVHFTKFSQSNLELILPS